MLKDYNQRACRLLSARRNREPYTMGRITEESVSNRCRDLHMESGLGFGPHPFETWYSFVLKNLQPVIVCSFN